MKPPEPNALSKPTADISINAGKDGIVQKETFPIVPKQGDNSEVLRPVKLSDLKLIKSLCGELQDSKIKWDEIILAVSFLGFGGTLSALISDIGMDSSSGKAMYIGAPIISFAGIVFVVMNKILRKEKTGNRANTIEQLVDQHLEQ